MKITVENTSSLSDLDALGTVWLILNEASEQKPIINSNPGEGVNPDYLQGMQDCANGVPHQGGQSASYEEGYAYQYWVEQLQTERCT